MNFYDMLKAKAIGNSGGGDTPSPSGDPHFSLLLYNDVFSDVYAVMDSTTGDYQLPNAQALHNATQIVLITPVKSITNHDIINSLSSGVYFTPASDFSIDFELEDGSDEITAGDGKLYNIYFDGIGLSASKTEADFFTSLT